MSHIKTFARLKPSEELYEDYEIQGKKVFSIRVPEFVRDYGVMPTKNRTPTISYDFMFNHVFDTRAGQEEVYNTVAQEIVTGFLDGYNGTIFAYGQTGTGKTYTVEGSAVRYSDRGLAPRALAQIYKSLEKREGEELALHISYLEIYQEVAYDLLSTTARTASPVAVFPRVTVMEGAGGSCQIRNLSFHLAPSEDVAHALLLQGQANRKVAETPVNQRSSRSHAVFTIYLSARKAQSDIITRSKLHLVDLAGSERVAKTGVDGQQLTEAKSINLSLHHLETVIIALQGEAGQAQFRASSANRSNNSFAAQGPRPSSADGVRRHVPYRNSLLTMVLRDSLGGNCLTAMIATVSLELQNIGETLSTCRFAQRVACIANHARRNEEIDDKTLIQHLKRRVAELEAQMACLRLSQQESGGERVPEEEEGSSKLTDEDKIACAHIVQEYLAGRISDPVMAGMTSPFKFRECLRILKKMVMNKYFQAVLGPNPPTQSTNQLVSQPSGQPVSQPAASAVHENAGASQNSANQGHVRGNGETGTASTNAPSQQPQGESGPANSADPAPNGIIDTDELIFNIQKLYAATHRQGRNRQATLQTTQVENRANSPKSPARPEPYKSPYERKREKEIRKLTTKLEDMKKSKEATEQHLNILRLNTAIGELTNTENILRNKIQVTREQIADQHAYLLHLRHTEANTEIKQREKLVEDQLLKREARFQKKLDEVLQRKAELETQAAQAAGLEVDDEGQTRSGSGGKRSLEEQFSQYKKRNGTLNTRQVFDMLKSEEKKHTKMSKEAEVEKKVLMTKQLAQKETATREKLRELKEMLRKSQEESVLGQTASYSSDFYVPNEMAAGANGFGPERSESPTPAEKDGGREEEMRRTYVLETKDKKEKKANSTPCTVEDLESSFTRGDDQDRDIGYVPQAPAINRESREITRVSSDGPGNANKVSAASKYGQPATVMNIGDRQSQSQHQENSHQSTQNVESSGTTQTSSQPGSHVELRWERPYSRPSTAASTHSNHWVTPQERKRTNNSSTASGSDNLSHSSPTVPSTLQKGGYSGARSVNPSEPESRSPQDTTLEWKACSTDTSQQNGWVGETFSHSEPARNSHHPQDSQKHTSHYIVAVESEGQGHDGDSDDLERFIPKVMPSEYIRSMGNRDKFDARKMGLSSKTFDSALSSMLNDESKTVTYGFEYYDQYARSSKNTVTNKSSVQKSSEPRIVAVSSKEPAPHKEPHVLRENLASAWGPEAKHSPVSLRLAQFLADDGNDRAKPPLPKKEAKTSKPEPSGKFLEQLTQLQDDSPHPEEAEVMSPRIQAMQDTQRESTYMGRVQAERERIAKIRKARDAAEAIQRAWRRYSQYSS